MHGALKLPMSAVKDALCQLGIQVYVTPRTASDELKARDMACRRARGCQGRWGPAGTRWAASGFIEWVPFLEDKGESVVGGYLGNG